MLAAPKMWKAPKVGEARSSGGVTGASAKTCVSFMARSSQLRSRRPPAVNPVATTGRSCLAASRNSEPSLAFHSLTTPSTAPVATSAPSGLTAIERTPFSPAAASQRTCPLRLSATRLPFVVPT